MKDGKHLAQVPTLCSLWVDGKSMQYFTPSSRVVPTTAYLHSFDITLRYCDSPFPPETNPLGSFLFLAASYLLLKVEHTQPLSAHSTSYSYILQ